MILFYIDPGTGSMLFAIILGLATTVYFMAKTLVARIKLKTALGRTDRKSRSLTKAKIAIYSEDARYWNVFKPILEELERRGEAALYLCPNEGDPASSMGYKHIEVKHIGMGVKAFAHLNFLEANLCLMTTPGLDVYQLKRSRGVGHYCHILHAPDDATSYRLFGIDYFDSILLTGEYQSKDIRALEKKRGTRCKELEVIGCTYLDELSQRMHAQGLGTQGLPTQSMQEQSLRSNPQPATNEVTILVAPSWGPNGLLSKYGWAIIEPLLKMNVRIIIRPHPQSLLSEAKLIDTLKNTVTSQSGMHAATIEWDFSHDNLASLSRASLMVSDFSGVVFDFAFLCGKPSVYALQNFDFRLYDADDIDGTMWKFDTLERIGRRLESAEIEHMDRIINEMVSADNYTKEIEKAKDVAWQYRGESASRAVDFIIEHSR